MVGGVKMLIRKCDFCEKEIIDKTPFWYLSARKISFGRAEESSGSKKMADIELCEECMEKLGISEKAKEYAYVFGGEEK